MKTNCVKILSSVILGALVIAGCDPGDEGEAALLDQEIDEEADEREGVDALDDFAVELGDPSAAGVDCPPHANFCFWKLANYVGKPMVLTAGAFAISDFPDGVRSALKVAGAYRVRMHSEPNFKGSCLVLGPAEKHAQTPNLAFVARSARRIDPGAPGCP